MQPAIYHVRKVSVGFKRKYRISADDDGQPGDLLAYAEKKLKATDETDLYRDEQRSEPLATVRESSASFRAALTGYEVFDADGRCLGSFGVLVSKSIERTTWQLEQPGLGRLIGKERSVAVARARRLVGLVSGVASEFVNAVAKYHFDFELEGRPMLRIEKPKVWDDWYRVTVLDPSLDRTLVFALTVSLEARQRG